MLLATKAIIEGKLSKLRGSMLARDAGWVLLGQGASFLFQVGYFVLLARVLGVEQYGVFAGASAFVSIAMPFSTLGAGMLFMRYVSADSNQFRQYWGNILLSTVGANALIIPMLYAVAPHLLNAASASIILLVAIANCLLGQFIQCVVQIFQSFQRLRAAAFWSASINVLRLAAAALLMTLMHHVTAWQWAAVSVITSLLIAVAGAYAVTAKYGLPRLEPHLAIKRAPEGLLFSASNSTACVYNDIDKTLLSHYGMNVANGIYTTAYRIIDMASISVTSVEWAASPRFFREAKQGVLHIVRKARGILGHVVLIGALAGGISFACAPLIPHMLGPGFAQCTQALRWLCLLPLFRGIHQISGAALTGCGYQRFRTAAQVAVALLNLSLNLVWIPAYGWIGAAWASLITDCALGILCLAILSWVAIGARKAEQAAFVASGGDGR